MVKTHPMWNHFPDIQNFLLECLELIIEKTTIDNHDIKKSVTNLIDSRGKLLRPAYFIFFLNSVMLVWINMKRWLQPLHPRKYCI